MASHVVVIDSSARRAVIKTTPGKPLSSVLEEACAKLGLDASRHGLRNNNNNNSNNNNRMLDLSQPVRLTGLSSGAKLQLVIFSRSPSVVNVALQLQEVEQGSQGHSGGRMTGKFPSTTTLWHILRQFESSKEGLQPKRNFTARAVSQVEGGGSGAGRLYYETPVIQIMGREIVSFTDLQKTLAQLGYNSGSVLLRLGFRRTETALEEAMSDIGQYFKSVEGEDTGCAYSSSVAHSVSAPKASAPVLSKEVSEAALSPEPHSPAAPRSPSKTPPTNPLSPQSPQRERSGVSSKTAGFAEPSSLGDHIVSGPSQRPISVFAPPSASSPMAARQAYNERDYEPTIDHAKLHQSRLSATSRNKRLPTDAELADETESHAKKVADVKQVEIKVRFPDQTQVISTFFNSDTGDTLYEFVHGLMEKENEPFVINFSSAKGPKSVPKEGCTKLISGLGMVGRVLVNVVWEEGASSEARGGMVLKEEFQQKAREIEVKEVEGVEVDEKDIQSAEGKGKQKEDGKERKGGVPKWLKLPGKK